MVNLLRRPRVLPVKNTDRIASRWRVALLLSWFRTRGNTAIDSIIALSILVPGLSMLFGVKEIPNLVVSSVASLTFGYAWVALLVIGGLALIIGVVTRSKFPTIAWTGEYVGWLSTMFGVLFYAASAIASFGFISGLVTAGFCLALVLFCFKMWLVRTDQLHQASTNYDCVGERIAGKD